MVRRTNRTMSYVTETERGTVAASSTVMEDCHEGWILHHQVSRNQPDTGTTVRFDRCHSISSVARVLLTFDYV